MVPGRSCLGMEEAGRIGGPGYQQNKEGEAMTISQRVKFLALCKSVVDTMAANDESLRDLFDAFLDTPVDEWPPGAGERMAARGTVAERLLWELTVSADTEPGEPIIVSG